MIRRKAKYVFFVFFGLMTLFVIDRHKLPLLDSQSPVWER